MKIRNAALILCLFVFLSHLGGGASVPAGEGKLRVLVLEGTPYQMGMIHGKALKPEITELIKRWKADLARTYKVPAEDFIKKFLKYTDFRPSIERWTPGLLDEVRGIADGAGVEFEPFSRRYTRIVTRGSITLGPTAAPSWSWGRNRRFISRPAVRMSSPSRSSIFRLKKPIHHPPGKSLSKFLFYNFEPGIFLFDDLADVFEEEAAVDLDPGALDGQGASFEDLERHPEIELLDHARIL